MVAFDHRKTTPEIFLSLDTRYDLEVDDVRIEPRLRGNQYGMKLYLAIVDFYHEPLYSGSHQTSASNNGIWKKLIQQYPDRVVGFDKITRQDYKLKATTKTLITLPDRKHIYNTIKSTIYNDHPKYYQKLVNTRLLKLLPA